MDDHYKIVRFDEYCKKCKDAKTDEREKQADYMREYKSK